MRASLRGSSLFAAVFLVNQWASCYGQGGCQNPAGVSVPEGTAWVAQDGCNVCVCTLLESVECQTWRNCNDNLGSPGIHHTLGAPGDPVCVYAQSEVYRVGEGWTAKDHCNHCLCTARGMNCTFRPCSSQGFAEPKPTGSTMEFMDCPYKGRLFRYGDQFLADDGCNTCVCIMPGNFATFPACTSTPCDDVAVVG